MIFWLIPLVLIVLAIFVFKYAYNADELGVLFGFMGGLIVVGFLGAMITSTYLVMEHKAALTQVRRDIPITEAKIASLSKNIEAYTGKYPMEKDLYKSIDGLKVILQMPEIKSDKFLEVQCQKLLDLQASIFDLRMKENQIKANLDWHKNRMYSFTLTSPDYEEDNVQTITVEVAK